MRMDESEEKKRIFFTTYDFGFLIFATSREGLVPPTVRTLPKKDLAFTEKVVISKDFFAR